MQTKCDNAIKQLKNINNTFGDIRYKKAEIDKEATSVVAYFVTDVSLSSYEVSDLTSFLKTQLNANYQLEVKVEKAVVDKDISKIAILKYVESKHFSISNLIKIEDITIICAGKTTKYELNITKDLVEYFERSSLLIEMDEYLSRNYSSNFSGSVKIKQSVEEIKEYEIETLTNKDFNITKKRTVKMRFVTKYCDTETYEEATLIEDGENTLGQVFFAGTIVDIEKRQTKSGKPFYLITINDKSSTIRGMFFTADKTKIQKTDKLGVGSVIILRGENQEYNEHLSLTIRGYHLCEFPENYQVEEIESKKVPNEYKVVKPTPAELIKQGDIFTKVVELDEFVKNNTFTIVDIETTGTNTSTDKITEIGAVRIENGEIVSKFQTLINPEIKLSEKIVKLTGITDDMLKDAPKIQEVYPDFFKYVSGTIFIAHNAEFDYKFLKNVGKDNGYVLNNEVLDTLVISREVLPWLKNHKLNTVCEHYGIEFHHHRALADAFATAELFLELQKDKKSKEN